MNPDITTPLAVPLRTPASETSATLYCFPYAGGGHDVYQPLARLLPTRITPVGINLPAGDAGRPTYPTVQTAVDAIATAIAAQHDTSRSAQADGSHLVGLFGHSGGGLLAYETARCLRGRGFTLALLAVSAVPAPAAAPQLMRLLTNPLYFEQVIHEEQRISTDIRTLVSFALRRDLPMYTAYTYEEGALLDFPITVYGGDEDHIVPHTDLAEWSSYTAAHCTVRTYPGGHMYLRDRWGTLATHLATDLSPRRTHN
ncbi:thioesterase II family protein [Kitasatospora sp. LaBMicrA B282]|uniref:thioesterase II family protein n=1 Tax=Kitasatospora sp. LaBMicrA B282 TaxID=3420949 RepID=UPI003D0D6FBE